MLEVVQKICLCENREVCGTSRNVCSVVKFGIKNYYTSSSIVRKLVPVNTAWRVFSLRMEERPPIWRPAASILNKQSRTTDKGRSSSLGLCEVLETLHRKIWHIYGILTGASDLD